MARGRHLDERLDEGIAGRTVMDGRLKKVAEFEWRGELAAWVGPDGKVVSVEKDWELQQEAERLFQGQVMERMEMARGIFHSMSGSRERKAAHNWLREAYEL